MNTDQLLGMANYAGKLLVEGGVEIYQVEETMVRLCTNFSEVRDAQSFVTTTGIMFSTTVASKTHIKIPRVRTRGVDLDCIDKINSLPRETVVQDYTIEELALKLREIENEQHCSFWVIMFFGALGVGGFAVSFGGNHLEAGCSFLIGLLVRAVSAFMEQRGPYGFSMNAIVAASDAPAALGAHTFCPDTDVGILIMSSIVLLVPGLAIISAIRDMVSEDYLSGVARATEVFPVAIAIAVDIDAVLSMSIGLDGGM